MPDRCPACGTPVERPADEAMRYCPNVSCPGRVLEGIVHFASRDAMDIRGLGYERVRQLLDAGLIANVADLYDLTADQLVELERFAEQSAEQLVAAIAASKEQPLSTAALRPRHPARGQDGGPAAGPAVRHDGRRSWRPTRTPINDVPGIGRAIAEAVVAFFARAAEPGADRAARNGRAHLHRAARRRGRTARWSGKTYVLTGTLPTLSRGAGHRADRGAPADGWRAA